MIVAFSLLAAVSALPTQGFVSIGGSHGVEVYRREQGPGIELAGVGNFPAPPAAVEHLLIDYPSHPKWVRHLAESHVLAKGPNQLLVYERLDLPLVEDRDYTLRVGWHQRGEVRIVHFTVDPQAGPPPRHRVVRVKLHEGEWQLEPTADGRGTRALYRFHIDLGGAMPGWMGRGQAAKDLPKLFESIRHQLAKAPI
jgi:hypothetical protein